MLYSKKKKKEKRGEIFVQVGVVQLYSRCLSGSSDQMDQQVQHRPAQSIFSKETMAQLTRLPRVDVWRNKFIFTPLSSVESD